jgi:hypothetical protein
MEKSIARWSTSREACPTLFFETSLYVKMWQGSLELLRMAQDRGRWQTVVKMLINLCVPQHAKNFLASWATVSFSETTLYHGVHHLLYHIMQKKSKSCNLQQLWNKRFARYHNFLGTRIFYLICSCKPLWQIKTFNCSCFLYCTFCPLFITTYPMWNMYNRKKPKRQSMEKQNVVIPLIQVQLTELSMSSTFGNSNFYST